MASISHWLSVTFPKARHAFEVGRDKLKRNFKGFVGYFKRRAVRQLENTGRQFQDSVDNMPKPVVHNWTNVQETVAKAFISGKKLDLENPPVFHVTPQTLDEIEDLENRIKNTELLLRKMKEKSIEKLVGKSDNAAERIKNEEKSVRDRNIKVLKNAFESIRTNKKQRNHFARSYLLYGTATGAGENKLAATGVVDEYRNLLEMKSKEESVPDRVEICRKAVDEAKNQLKEVFDSLNTQVEAFTAQATVDAPRPILDPQQELINQLVCTKQAIDDLEEISSNEAKLTQFLMNYAETLEKEKSESSRDDTVNDLERKFLGESDE